MFSKFKSLHQTYSRSGVNVRTALQYTALMSFANGIWGFTVLSGYLKVITGSNTDVGVAEGIQGALQVLLAFPAGYFADLYGRDFVLKLASIIGLIAVMSILCALYSGSYFFLCVGLGFYGSYVGMSYAPLEALYADSTTDKERPKMTTLKYTILLLTSSSGPLTSIFLFLVVGNFWTPFELKFVFSVGVILLLPSLWKVTQFDDESANSTGEKLAEEVQEKHFDTMLAPLLEESEQQNEGKKSESALYWVPRIIVSTDLLNGISSGMTQKFFPLFFKEEALMSPIQVQTQLFLSTLAIAIAAPFAHHLTTKIGTVNMLLCFQVPGTILLMSVHFMSSAMWQNKIFIGIVFIMRDVFMNGPGPLKKAILMEYVPKKDRGKWSAFESLKMFGWSGSAVFGGILMDNYGYGIVFFATGVLQLFYTLCNLFLKNFDVR